MERALVSVRIDSGFALRLLAAITATIVTFSIAGQFSRHFLGHGRLLGFVKLFDVRGEGNVPAIFSSAMLACAAFLLIALARHLSSIQGRDYVRWYALAVAFLFLSVDEAFMIHETLNQPLRELTGLTGYFHFAWVLPYLIAVAALGLFVMPAVFRTPADIRNLFILSGFLYVGGAVGVEMISANYFVETNIEEVGVSFTYILITTLEESMEMAGVVVFIYTVLRLLERQQPPARFDIGFGRNTPAE